MHNYTNKKRLDQMNAQEDETNSKGSDGDFSSSENCNEGNKE